jgi:hypothetical protein
MLIFLCMKLRIISNEYEGNMYLFSKVNNITFAGLMCKIVYQMHT